MPLGFPNGADGIFECNIPTSYLVAAARGFAITDMAIYLVLATMLGEIGMDGVELVVDVLAGISNNSSKLLVRQRLMTIVCQNRFLCFFQ